LQKYKLSDEEKKKHKEQQCLISAFPESSKAGVEELVLNVAPGAFARGMFKLINSLDVNWPEDTCCLNNASGLVSTESQVFEMYLKGCRLAFLTVTVSVSKYFK
jgi:hypothetical protein